MAERTAEVVDIEFEVTVKEEGWSYTEIKHECTSCHRFVDEKFVYCPYCGAKLEFTGRIAGHGYYDK